MPIKIITKDKYTLSIYSNGMAEFLVREGIELNGTVAREMKNDLVKIIRSNICYILLGGGEFFNVTIKARELGSSRKISSHLVALAFYSSNVSLQALGEMYKKIDKPYVHTRIFNNRDSARDWLLEQIEKEKQQ
jgi:hypothetical protein